MRRIRLLCVYALLCFCSAAWASEPLIYGANAIYTATRIRANQNFYQRAVAAQSYVVKNQRHLKGDVGESVMHTLLTDRHLGGTWVQTNPKFAQPGRQGFDATYVRYENGHPRKLFIGEAKYGSSQLGKTKDGLQMSGTWVRKRLATQVNGLGKAANAVRRGDVTFSSSGKNENAMQLRAFDKDGNSRKISVWWERKGGRDVLNVDTNGRDIPKENVRNALKEVQKLYQDNLTALRRGEILYSGRVFKNIRFTGNDVMLDIVDMSDGRKTGHFNTSNPKISNYQKKRIIAAVRKVTRDHFVTLMGLSEQNAKKIVQLISKNMTVEALLSIRGSNALRRELIKAQMENGVSRIEAQRQADKLLKLSKEGQHALRRTFAIRTARDAAYAGVTGALIDIASQFWRSGTVDWERTIKTAAFTAVTSGIGQYAGHYALNSAFGRRVVAHTARLLHVRAGTVAEVGGGIVTSLIGAYGAYALGQIDLETANRMAATSTAALIGSKVVVAGVTGLVATFGTAGTGTAIATLSGAAATKATLAAIGTLGHSAIGTSIASAVGISSVAMGGLVLGGVGFIAYMLFDALFSPSEGELIAEQMARQRELLRGHLDIARYGI